MSNRSSPCSDLSSFPVTTETPDELRGYGHLLDDLTIDEALQALHARLLSRILNTETQVRQMRQALDSLHEESLSCDQFDQLLSKHCQYILDFGVLQQSVDYKRFLHLARLRASKNPSSPTSLS